MRKATWITAGLMVAAVSTAVAGPSTYFGSAEPPKEAKQATASVSIQLPPHVLAGGETFATATPILALPFSDGGNTCNAVDDYFPSCAFGGASTSPDLVYVYRPTTDTCINVSLCGSGFDTVVHVYKNDAATMVACNDDFCGLQSEVDGVAVAAGNSYYIVVDGWNVSCGDYLINVTECPPPCVVDCPPGALHEPEPACFDGFVDTFDGGCNSTPVVFADLECNDLGIVVCGTYGTYIDAATGGAFRDTDWYRIVLTQPTTIDYCVSGQAVTRIFVIDGNHGCPVTSTDLLCTNVANPCDPACCQVSLAPGTYYLFAGTDAFDGVPCGSQYVLRLAGYVCPPVAVTPAPWSKVKGLYR